MKTKEKMYEQIKQHGENLNAIFKTEHEAVALCKKLRRIEAQAHKIAEDYCNGENGVDTDTIDTFTDPIIEKVYKVLGTRKLPVNFNGDARGYALKINDKIMRQHGYRLYTDMGGYGILAPEFNGK